MFSRTSFSVLTVAIVVACCSAPTPCAALAMGGINATALRLTFQDPTLQAYTHMPATDTLLSSLQSMYSKTWMLTSTRAVLTRTADWDSACELACSTFPVASMVSAIRAFCDNETANAGGALLILQQLDCDGSALYAYNSGVLARGVHGLYQYGVAGALVFEDDGTAPAPAGTWTAAGPAAGVPLAPTLGVGALLTVAAVAHQAGVPVDIPQAWFREHDRMRDPFSSAISGFNKVVGGVLDDFEGLAGMFSGSSMSTIIAKDSCLGFNTFSAATDVQVLECLDDAHAPEWINLYFDDLAAFFGGDVSKVQAQLLDWTYARGANWSRDVPAFTNTGVSSYINTKVFKNHDDAGGCSNWVVVTFNSSFTLAPDLLVWLTSKSSFLGLSSSTSTWIQQVPHEISLNDVQALELLSQIIMFGAYAETQGLPFVWPTLPNCPQKGAVDGAAAAADPPSVASLLLATLKNVTDGVIADLPPAPPADAPALVEGVLGTGAQAFVNVPPEEVKTVQASWTAANNWPPSVANAFMGIVASTSETFATFSESYTAPDGVTWAVVTGAARNYNGTVTMAYVHAQGAGTLLQQYYGAERVVSCGPFTVTTYGSPPTCGMGQPPGCGTQMPNSPPCSFCPIISAGAIPYRVTPSTNCAVLRGTAQLTEQIQVFGEGYCTQPTGMICFGRMGTPAMTTLDYSACRNPNNLQLCNRPDTAAELADVTTALAFAARNQVRAQMNLLAVSLNLPVPYPSFV